MPNNRLDLLEPLIIHQLSIDCVIFGFHEGEMKVLLLQMLEDSAWMLPGGFVYQTEDLDDAVKRVLKQRTGLEDIYLRQFKIFGDKDRFIGEELAVNLKSLDIEISKDHWLMKRFISIGFYGLIDYTEVNENEDFYSFDCQWVELEKMPNLMLDHQRIFEEAFKAMFFAFKKEYIGFNLLPVEFTMSEVQELFESVLNIKLTRSNFQRKILSLGILERTEKKFEGKAHKAPYLYRLREDWETITIF